MKKTAPGSGDIIKGIQPASNARRGLCSIVEEDLVDRCDRGVVQPQGARAGICICRRRRKGEVDAARVTLGRRFNDLGQARIGDHSPVRGRRRIIAIARRAARGRAGEPVQARGGLGIHQGESCCQAIGQIGRNRVAATEPVGQLGGQGRLEGGRRRQSQPLGDQVVDKIIRKLRRRQHDQAWVLLSRTVSANWSTSKNPEPLSRWEVTS